MIKPIQDSITFGNGIQDFMSQTSKPVSETAKTIETTASPKVSLEKTPAEDSVNLNQEQQNSAVTKPTQNKPTVKTRFLDTLKTINTLRSTTNGLKRGICEGVVGAGVVGFIGKNMKEAKGEIGKTIAGMFKDAGLAIGHVISKSIPHIVTKSPVENVKTIVNAPGRFFTSYLKGNKLTSALAIITFAGITAFRTIQGKMIANMRNANIDHYTNTKH